MKLLDISRAIRAGAPVYPGDPPLRMETLVEMPFRLTALTLTTHVLTHVDAPRHFFPDGPAIDDIPVGRFTGEALVVEVSGPVVAARHVPESCRGLNVLFKTRHSGPWPAEFDCGHVYLDPEAARLLAARGANLAGIDYLDVDRYGDQDYPAHRALLGAGVLILEGLDLAAAPPGRYHLFAFPLRIEAGDGAPVRALLGAGPG